MNEPEKSYFKPNKKTANNIVYIEGVLLLLIVIGMGILWWMLTGLSKKSEMSSLRFPTGDFKVVSKSNGNFEKREKKEVIGFLPSWALAQNQPVHLEHLTELVYFGLGVTEKGELIKFDTDNSPVWEWRYFTSDVFSKIRDEAKSRRIKVLVAIKNFDNTSIDELISSDSAIATFTAQLLSLVEMYQLDGVNLDFEYVTDTNYPTSQYFNKFLSRLALSLKKNNPDFIFSIDVNATAVTKDTAYDMVKIGDVVDEVILMAYDYRQINSTRSGPPAPLEGSSNEHSISESVDSLRGRLHFDKLVLGVPFYGYEWQTVDAKHKSGTVSDSGALASYKRVRQLIQSRDDIVYHWDDAAKAPWMVYRQSGAVKQIYYEDEKSIAAKAEYVKTQQMKGMAIWSLGNEGEYDDLWKAMINGLQ